VNQIKITRRNALVALGAGIATAGFTSSAVAAELVTLEDAVELLRNALVDGDGNVLQKIVHDHLSYSHSDGRVWTKDVLLENIAGKKRYLAITTSQQTVDVLGQVGIVRHTYDVVNNQGDGKSSTSHIKVLMCWIKSDTTWQLLARSGT